MFIVFWAKYQYTKQYIDILQNPKNLHIENVQEILWKVKCVFRDRFVPYGHTQPVVNQT